MNVATAGAIKGGLDADDLKKIGCQVMLSNTYHLHVRPGDDLVNELGGLHKFTGWEVLFLPTAADFRFFHLQSSVKLKKRA